ncbi:hypothetical protein OUZ56_003861 [Daphnia magna]|uniref:Uncharacterized protein n=1 Tax=Daphnia magna TaxID=35525 RepID=A0ABQ9YN10_9CRUS|nr:hypothetical protein OUZ56_003861 [Daphnia magna]
MSRSQYQLLPGFTFLFTPSKELPEGITVDQFLGETNDKGEYNLLIRNISNIFATTDSQLGYTGLIKHSIDTQGRGPIRLRPYRAARKHQEELRRQIKEMLDKDIAELSTSPGRHLLYS